MLTIGFIGAGNMGGAMANASSKIGEVYIYDKNTAVYNNFPAEIKRADSINEVLQNCKIIVLSIKPQFYADVIAEIKGKIGEDQLVVTVSPSHTLQNMKDALGDVKLIRTMPNTPALIGSGVTAYTTVDTIDEELLDAFKAYFESFGSLTFVNEKLMPAVVAATGSSPAYVYMFIEAMADAAVSFGMPRAQAYEMVAAAVKGSAEMVLETKKHPGELKDAVTSPAGTTIDAVIALEDAGFRSAVIKGMQACYNKVLNM